MFHAPRFNTLLSTSHTPETRQLLNLERKIILHQKNLDNYGMFAFTLIFQWNEYVVFWHVQPKIL